MNSIQPWRLRSSHINMVHFISCSSPPLTPSIRPPPNILSKKYPPLRTAVLAAILKDMAQKDTIFHLLVHLVGCISYILEQYAMLCFYREELGLSHSQSGFYTQLTAFHYTEHFLSQQLVPCLLFIHTFKYHHYPHQLDSTWRRYKPLERACRKSSYLPESNLCLLTLNIKEIQWVEDITV